MAVGKRFSTDEPLTEHDVAERLSAAMLRVWKIVEDVVADPVLHRVVVGSRYLAVQPSQLVEALQRLEQVPPEMPPASSGSQRPSTESPSTEEPT